jgi:hypothetical protein
MSEGVQKMPSALELANERADALPTAQKVANDRVDALLATGPAAKDKQQDAAPTGNENAVTDIVHVPRTNSVEVKRQAVAVAEVVSEAGAKSEEGEEKKDLFGDDFVKVMEENKKNMSEIKKDDPMDTGRNESGGENKSMQEYLAGRSEAWDKKAGGFGAGAEKLIRSLGERYNKLGWKTKLAVGFGLGAGAASFATVSALVAGTFAVGLGAQRIAGMAGMFLKFEKHLQDTSKGESKGFLGRREWYQNIFKDSSEKQRKVIATIMAATYTGGMSLAIGGAVQVASESSYGEAVHDWLKHHYPFGHIEDTDAGSTTPEATGTGEESVATQKAETPAPETAPETVVPEAPPETVTEVVDVDTESPEQETAPETEGTETTATTEEPTSESEATPKEARDLLKEMIKKYETDLSAQEWRAEYAEPGNHTGAPDFRAEHPEFDGTQAPTEETVIVHDSVQTESPTAQLEQQSAGGTEPHPAQTPETSHYEVNSHEVSVDPDHSNAYFDGEGILIIHGGTLEERTQAAAAWVANDHSAQVYFDSTSSEGVLFWKHDVPHLSMAEWVDDGSMETGVYIKNDMNTPELRGVKIPLVDDLVKHAEPTAQAEIPKVDTAPTQLRAAEMPITTTDPNDMSANDNMQFTGPGDELERAEMQLGKQPLYHHSGPEGIPHAFGHVESGSVKGDFVYSPDGAVTSFNSSGLAHGEFKTLLTDDYGTVLVNRPTGNVGLARSVVENRARVIFNNTQALDELVKRGAQTSPEADFLRRSIRWTIEQTTKQYGVVFKPMKY